MQACEIFLLGSAEDIDGTRELVELTWRSVILPLTEEMWRFVSLHSNELF